MTWLSSIGKRGPRARTRDLRALLGCALVVLLSTQARGAPGAEARAVAAVREPARKPSLAPIKSGEASRHSPFDSGDCSLCHERKSARDPGPVRLTGNKGCFYCHEDFQAMMESRRSKHAPAETSCVSCHNPHNSAQKKLLVAAPLPLCLSCHVGVAQQMELPVKHAAVTDGAACMNCHVPHASKVEHLLARLPYDQCVQCHGKDGVTDSAGVKMTNMKKLLEENPVHHGPVAQKDCSACHEPHGAKIFRLLISAYPSTFYAPFDIQSYEMCFGCHDAQLATAEKTTTATRFRDGDRNLHFVHVNKPDRGRTCRACHEVHAARKTYQIRESVPFGAKGYKLQVNFVKRDDGGNCTQTCHTAREYRLVAPAQAKTK